MLKTLTIFCLTFVTAYGHAGLIRDQFTSTQVPLPLNTLANIVDKMEIIFHQDPTVELASFSKGSVFVSNKLFLYEPFYRKQNVLIPITDMLVNQSSFYFTALIEAYLTLVVEKGTSPYSSVYFSRVKALMKDVPAKHQVEAYRNALSAFGGTLFSIAISIERSFISNGEKICATFDKPQSSFKYWENQFDDRAAFPGEYYYNDNWVFSGYWLQKEDKELLMNAVLEGFWKGERVHDFKTRFCQN